MLSSKMQAALNSQINAEFWSAFLYLSMSADFASKGLMGFSNWMYVQYKEEEDHAQRFFNYIIDRNGKPEIQPIKAVKASWASPVEALADALAHEQKVTAMINNLVTIASEEKDYATQSMLKWFIDEQVEEEKTVQTLIDDLSMIKDNSFGLYTLDKDLGGRIYTPLVIK